MALPDISNLTADELNQLMQKAASAYEVKRQEASFKIQKHGKLR